MTQTAKPTTRFALTSDPKHSGGKINIINLETVTATASRFIVRSKRSDSMKVSDYDLSIDYSRQPDYIRQPKTQTLLKNAAKKSPLKLQNTELNLSA